jgi:large subunit ribosomal protein L21
MLLAEAFHVLILRHFGGSSLVSRVASKDAERLAAIQKFSTRQEFAVRAQPLSPLHQPNFIACQAELPTRGYSPIAPPTMAFLARTARRSLLEVPSTLPQAFILPFRAHITTVSHTLEAGNVPDPLIQSGQHTSSDLKQKLETPPSRPRATLTPVDPKPTANAREDVVAQHLTPSIRELLPLLHTQPAHYLSIHIHGHPYLLTEGDTLRLPFLMPNVKPGDVLRLNRATHIGSRDYTLKAPEVVKGTRDHGKKVFYLDERLFTCRARVVGVESEPMRIMRKTKRRQRHTRHVQSKHKYTVLKISEVEVKSLEQYETALKSIQ